MDAASPTPRAAERRTGRRQLLTGALGVAAAAGVSACSSVEPALDRLRGLAGDDGSTEPSAAPPSASSDPADPDVRLAVEVMLTSEAAATALENWAAGRRRGSARQRRLARAAAATHTRHAALVAGAVPAAADPGTGRLAPELTEALQTPKGTLTSAVRIEELAQAGLREAALAARSGPFASLLASMVAASAQHSAQLRGTVDIGGRA